MSIDLVLLAGGTAVHIITDESRHTWPPIIPLYEDLGGELSRVSGGDGIVVFLDYVAAEFQVIWYITTVFVEDKVIGSAPIGEGGP